MKSVADTYVLSNGVKIPCIGYGTWQVPEGQEAESALKTALEVGYRHIDTAQGYGNEASVGRAIKKSGVPREEIFVTSKLDNGSHGYAETYDAFEASMRRLDLDYLDLFLIHWPNPVAYRDHWQKTNAETWKAFEELHAAGRIRAIGISNFRPHHIEALLKTATTVPMVNQIRLCPGDAHEGTIDYCRRKGILLEAYSPLGVGEIFNDPDMKALAEKHHKSIAQIALRWSLQRGFLPLPKSVTPSRMRENIDLFDFELSDADMQKIDALEGIAGYAMDPDEAPF